MARSAAAPLLLIALLALLTSCGKVGDPLPPLPRAPLTVNQLAAAQQGNLIILEFPFARGTATDRLGRVDVYRLIEPSDAPAGLPEEEFAARAQIIASITELPPRPVTITYRDPIPASSGVTDQRLRYAVRLVDRDGRPAGFSNYAVIAPLATLALPPTDLTPRQTESAIEIAWRPPAANVNGTTPANVAAYNLYRREGEKTIKLNAEPLTEPRFIDRQFSFLTPYVYFARSLSLPPGASSPLEAIESEDSPPLSYTPRDTFAPAPPESIKLASINGIVSLFWPSNAEPDLAGYHIYRTEDEQAPPGTWIKLNPQLQTLTTYRDTRVEVGKRYFYQLTAVDTAGNESRRSETVSETVNP